MPTSVRNFNFRAALDMAQNKNWELLISPDAP